MLTVSTGEDWIPSMTSDFPLVPNPLMILPWKQQPVIFVRVFLMVFYNFTLQEEIAK